VGKRSDGFERRERDFYPTPYEAVLPLLPHLPERVRFVEPCAGDGRLVRHLERHGHHCIDAFDLEPQDASVRQANALNVWPTSGHMVITNFPWSRVMLHPLLDHWRLLMPVWTLLDANWLFTAGAAPYLRFVSDVVVVGRVKWIEGSKQTGKDDSIWMRIQADPCQTVFHNARVRAPYSRRPASLPSAPSHPSLP
jgi:hypothetical protein